MQRLMSRLHDEERGFTLIELMVVVLIIAILIAIAIPTFLGARQRAQDRAAQSSARNALTAAKTIFTDTEDYTNVTQTALESSEPSLTFIEDGESAGPNTVSWNDVDANNFRIAVYSRSGICFHLRDRTGPITGTDAGTTYAREDVGDTTSECESDRAEASLDNAFSATGWQ